MTKEDIKRKIYNQNYYKQNKIKMREYQKQYNKDIKNGIRKVKKRIYKSKKIINENLSINKGTFKIEF